MFIILSLCAAAVASSVNFADKGFLGKYEVDYKAATIFGAIAAGILALCVLPFSNLSSLSLRQEVIVIASGAILYVSYLLYWKTISRANASLVVVLIQLSPAIVLILGWLFLRETLSFIQVIGFCTILLSVVLFSADDSRKLLSMSFSNTFISGSLSAFLFAITAVMQKYALEHTTPVIGTALESLGVFVAGTLAFTLSRAIRADFFAVKRKHGFKPFLYIFIVESVWLLYRFLSYFATALGPVAIERALEGVRVFFALLYGAVLSRTWPGIFGQERKNLTIVKIAAACALIGGMYLIS